MSTAKPLFRITEKGLQQAIVDMARLFGWSVYHPYDSRRSTPGFPDLTMVRNERLVFAELKSERGIMMPEQADWLQRLRIAGAETYVWRPYQWISGEIEGLLR